MLATTKNCHGLGGTSPFWVANERASERRGREERRKRIALTFFPAPCSRVSFLGPLARDFSCYPLNGKPALRLLRFSLLWEMLHRHYYGSVNSKCTHTPKTICQVLTSPLALDSWTELLKLSSAVKPSNSNYFCKIYLPLSEWIAPFLAR